MSPEWKKKSKHVQRMTSNHCILFPWIKSNHAHHLTYQNLEREMPVRDIVPLSKTAVKGLNLTQQLKSEKTN